MTIRIPNNGKFYQPNKGEIFGNLYRTTGIDLKTNPGVLRLSSRLKVNIKDNDAGISGTSMGVPIGFVVHTQSSAAQYWCATGTGAFNVTGTGEMYVSADATGPNQAFTNDGTSGSPTNISLAASDMVEWLKFLYVSTFTVGTSQIKELQANWDTTWFTGTKSGSFVTNGSPKNMCVGFNNNLYITDDYKVIYVPTSGNAVTSGVGTLSFASTYRPIWIRSTSNRLWIGLMTMDASSGSQGYIGEWDASGTQLNKLYKIDAPCAPSAVVKDDTLYIVDAYGRVKKFYGGGFVEVARLPVANLNIEMPGIYSDLTNARWIHHRGMDLVDGRICINVNNLVSSGVYVKEMPSGVWELNEDDPNNVYLYHKNPPCAASTDWGQQLLVTAGALYGTKRTAGTYLAGYNYYTDATTPRYGIFYDDIATNTSKHGITETPFVLSSNAEDNFQSINYRFKPLTSGDHIISKIRNAKDANLPFISGTITWTSTSTFTTSDSNFANVVAGNEIEVVQGASATTTAHVSTITVNAGTYTVTLDEAIGPSSGTGKVMCTNYTKIIDISDTGIHRESTLISQPDTKIQVKTEYRGTLDFEVDDMTIITTKHK